MKTNFNIYFSPFISKFPYILLQIIIRDFYDIIFFLTFNNLIQCIYIIAYFFQVPHANRNM